MSKKLLCVTVKGKNHTWGFHTYMDPKHIPEWTADGLDIVLLENTIPMWVAQYGLVKQWCFLQDIWNFKNPFASKEGKAQTLEVPHNDEEN
jgi:hypothetical protein